MPKRPASLAQLALVHAAANRGESWATKTVSEWHGKSFSNLPDRVSKRGGRHLRKRRK